ncbi:putative serine/threonine-protein kinase pix13 [Turnera subulata]|uniref:non-specific serine/threonine protein kinase n=1 Tax=Turnera subulata TaxID=218843 RepID=A0A9Q0G9U2_9ROSI|nr:putative serine/threonine-protein kinase pix13 [Turnera subulata]
MNQFGANQSVEWMPASGGGDRPFWSGAATVSGSGCGGAGLSRERDLLRWTGLVSSVLPVNMGNCLGSSWGDPSPSSINNHNPPTPGTSRNNYSTTTTTDLSATSSSLGKSQFSAAVSEGDEETNPNGEILDSPNLKVFTFSDLRSATKNFKSDSLLGEGGFGKVFKGWLDERTLAPARAGTGMAVAIKKLNSESMQGFQEWQSEVNFLGRLSHPNLVKLLGYCWEEEELLLVYEFMQKGSLENHLFRRNPAIEPLSWDIRLKILIGAARGLAFLHSSEKQVIYRDFKASNILLDGNYNAKISDFGLAKFGPSGGESHVTTRVMGTYGYAAPEYIATGHLYVKSDVYGFGVVLLEMLTGLRALDTRRPNGQQTLVDWLKPILSRKKKFQAMMDVRVEGQYSTKAMVQAAQLTLKCTESDPKNRPAMKEVVEVLEQIDAMKVKHKPTKSTFGSSQKKNQRGRDQQSSSSSHRSPIQSRRQGV